MQIQYTPKDVARFWARVDKSGDCWIWTGYLMPKGYGSLYLGYKPVEGKKRRAYPIGITAHRFSYILHYGEIPPGMSVCHKCDNRACVRPDHLWLGTNGDNVRDMYAKGRGGYHGIPGELHPSAKLTEQQVYAIRARHRQLVNELAEEHHVTKQLIRLILAGKAWKHIA